MPTSLPWLYRRGGSDKRSGRDACCRKPNGAAGKAPASVGPLEKRVNLNGSFGVMLIVIAEPTA